MFRFYKAKSGVCRSVKLDESDKSCVYLDDEYKELPKECSEYKGSVANECESILPEAYNTMWLHANLREYPLVRILKLGYQKKYAKN